MHSLMKKIFLRYFQEDFLFYVNLEFFKFEILTNSEKSQEKEKKYFQHIFHFSLNFQKNVIKVEKHGKAAASRRRK